MNRLPDTPTTPAFIYDQATILRQVEVLQHWRALAGCGLLYSIKALPLAAVMRLLQARIDGFAVSSLFEARLARELAGQGGQIHITTPGLLPEQVAELGGLCDAISFNSLSQLQRLAPALGGHADIGLRINPGLSFLSDPRYDPCRSHSKLGAPIEAVAAAWRRHELPEGLSGLHCHTLFESRDFMPLQQTWTHIESRLGGLLRTLRWVNLGGGYLFDAAADLSGLYQLGTHLHTAYGLDVFFEPGKGLVGEAGTLVASIIDLFESDGRTVAILDTSVNHHPEVFEYQRRPRLLMEDTAGDCPVILAGGTCLSGDVFGEYRFAEPPAIGQRVAFGGLGAYSLSKAHRFNGHNLPDVYIRDGHGVLRLCRHFDYQDYHRCWGESPAAPQSLPVWGQQG